MFLMKFFDEIYDKTRVCQIYVTSLKIEQTWRKIRNDVE